MFFVGHFVLLNPSSLEDDFGGMRVIQPKDLLNFLKNEPTALAPEAPLTVAPSYSLRDSIIYSSDGSVSKIKMSARKSNLYQKEQIAHSRDVQMEFADHTQIEAKEALFFIAKDKVHFYGDVHTTFSNGAELFSEYAEVFTKPLTHVVIPTKESVRGRKHSKDNEVRFTSMGLDYLDSESKSLHLLSNVHVEIQNTKKTDVYSDQATYSHEKGLLYFFMNDSRPLSDQFVKVHQPDLNLKSRALEVSTSSKQELQTITAISDVWMEDLRDPVKTSSATSGRAVYDDRKNEIILTEFPQVYQDNDTITGDIIIFHRNTDLIEVKQSNAIYHNESKERSR